MKFARSTRETVLPSEVEWWGEESGESVDWMREPVWEMVTGIGAVESG